MDDHTREMRMREMASRGDDTAEITTRQFEVLDSEHDGTKTSASYIDMGSRDDDTVEIVQGPPEAPLPEPARRAIHRLKNFAMAGDKQELVLARRLPIDENPVSAYLAGLAASSRRPMRTNLETIAHFVSGGRAKAMELAWWKLRYQHTSLVRSTLAETYAPATANLMLSAMRGVLKACFRLGYMSADDLQRAADVPPVRGSRLPPRPRHRARRALRPLPHMLHR